MGPDLHDEIGAKCQTKENFKIHKILLQQNRLSKHKCLKKNLEWIDHIQTIIRSLNIKKNNKDHLQNISEELTQTKGKMMEVILDKILNILEQVGNYTFFQT